jgi:hypothetical protein
VFGRSRYSAGRWGIDPKAASATIAAESATSAPPELHLNPLGRITAESATLAAVQTSLFGLSPITGVSSSIAGSRLVIKPVTTIVTATTATASGVIAWDAQDNPTTLWTII